MGEGRRRGLNKGDDCTDSKKITKHEPTKERKLKKLLSTEKS